MRYTKAYNSNKPPRILSIPKNLRKAGKEGTK